MKYALLALQYLPSILAAVKAVEDTVGSGNGKAKRQIVLDSFTAAAKVGEGVDEKHVAVASALIDLTVASLNASGVLGKPSAAAQ